MCGIVGYIGQKDSREIILSGLKKLEYRGYDSAGIELYDCDDFLFKSYKDIGRVAHLESITEYDYETCLGIGHTRWATHGAPSKCNSHPIKSESNRFSVVHNGVVDNYKELTSRYLSTSIFHSETDTEVIAHLIDKFSFEMSVDKAIRKTMSVLEGSYALAIIDTEHPDKLYACKNKSPLLLGISEDGVIIASDLMAVAKYSKSYIPLEDKTFIEITPLGYKITDIIGEETNYEIKEVDVNYDDIEKGEFPHFMLKEISEQPSVIRNIVTKYFVEDNIIIDQNIVDAVKKSDRLYIIAAGTSMNAGFIGKEMFEKFSNIPCEVHIASEFAYNMPLLSSNPLFIFISQSGETADLRAVLINIKTKGYPSLTITNVRTSTLARETDNYLEIFAGPEIAIASTKAYTAQIAILSILACSVGDLKHLNLRKELSKAAIAMDNIIDKKEYIKEIVKEYITKDNCFYIGRGIDYYISLEASLKLKEISYIQTEGFAAGELKHGTIALIEKDTPVIALISQSNIKKNTRSNLNEVKSRGAKTLVISCESISEREDQIIVGDSHESLSPLLLVIPTQLISYYAALNLNRDIDKPRNLAKSVTVE